MTMSRLEKRRRAKRKRFRLILKIFIVFFSTLFLLVSGSIAYLAHKIDRVSSDSPEHISDLRDESVDPNKNNFSILFLGVDDRSGNLNGLTDAIILATFNVKEGSVKMVSIPRDSYVEIPGRGYDKINHAHSYGGLKLSIETVENLLEIPVDYYVKLNFTAFVEIIDALGGIEVDVPFTFTEMDSYDRPNAITLYEGRQTLNGEEALAYARMRKHDPLGDIGRGERQQEVIKAVIQKGASISSITKYDDILESLEKHLETNLTFKDIVSLHKYRNSVQNFDTYLLEGNHMTIGGVYYYDLDDESLYIVKQKLKNHLEFKWRPHY